MKASAILAIILESILYGISSFLFGIAVWSLTYQRKSAEVPRSMLAAACLLFLLSTLRVVLDVSHVWEGFMYSTNIDLFFDDVSKDTVKNALYEVETLVGDAIVIYRCYVVWQRIDVIIIPVIGWFTVAVTATYTVWSMSQLPMTPDIVFLQETRKWVIAFYTMALFTNLIATSVLAFKLWLVHRRSSRLRTTKSKVYPILLVIMECGALYSMSLVTMMATYLSGSNGAYIILDMIGQIIPITFSLIIVRTAMLRFSESTGQGLFTSTMTRTWPSDRLPSTRPMKVQIDRMTVTDSDTSKVSGVSSAHIDALEDTYHSKVLHCP